MEYENLLTKKEGGVGWIIINRPDKLNALNRGTIKELYKAFLSFKEDTEVKAIILSGSGEKAFVAGADISELARLDFTTGKKYVLEGQELTKLIENFNKPVIAAINGYALGGGTELALACHMRIASENAKLGTPEVGVGLIPGWGATQRLPKVIGLGRAKELILTGVHITSNAAENLGLVNKVVTPEELINTAKEMAQKIADNAPVAVKLAKSTINVAFDVNIDEGYKHELDAEKKCFETEDLQEGIQALFDKRKPNFSGK